MGSSKRSWRVRVLAVLIAATVAVCAWASAHVWDEAYGAGPPYFGRSTNMDKWQEPSSRLLWLNGPGLVLVTALLTAIWKLRQSRSP